MSDTFEALADTLRHAGWSVQEGAPAATLPGQLVDFPAIREFAGRFIHCVAPDEQAWLFGSECFLETNEDAFAWNFLEQEISLPAAVGNEAWADEVRAFWSEHLPFALSCRGDYTYLAIDRRGRVWSGVAPDLEAPTKVAASFGEFVRRLDDEAKAGSGELFDDWIR